MSRRGNSSKIAYPAILGALSLIFVYVAAIAPSGSWGIVAVAGLFPAAAVVSVGFRSGLLCWAGVSILSFLLIPDKLCALLYTALFGLYPLVKALIERLRNKPIQYVIKLAFFNASFTLVFLIMRAAVLDSFPERLATAWILYLLGNIVFLVYDFGFSKLIALYIARIRRASR